MGYDIYDIYIYIYIYIWQHKINPIPRIGFHRKWKMRAPHYTCVTEAKRKHNGSKTEASKIYGKGSWKRAFHFYGSSSEAFADRGPGKGDSGTIWRPNLLAEEAQTHGVPGNRMKRTRNGSGTQTIFTESPIWAPRPFCTFCMFACTSEALSEPIYDIFEMCPQRFHKEIVRMRGQWKQHGSFP